MFDNITTASVTQTPHPICTHSRASTPHKYITDQQCFEIYEGVVAQEGWRERQNMHWLKAPDSPIQSRPKEHQLFCILTQRLITRKCVQGWQMQMETDSDKNDNGIGLEGVTEVEAGCCLKYLIIDTEPVRCCLTLEECECHQKIAKTLKWNTLMMRARVCVHLCILCVDRLYSMFAEQAKRLWPVRVTELYHHYNHYLSSGHKM